MKTYIMRVRVEFVAENDDAAIDIEQRVVNALVAEKGLEDEHGVHNIDIYTEDAETGEEV